MTSITVPCGNPLPFRLTTVNELHAYCSKAHGNKPISGLHGNLALIYKTLQFAYRVLPGRAPTYLTELLGPLPTILGTKIWLAAAASPSSI